MKAQNCGRATPERDDRLPKKKLNTQEELSEPVRVRLFGPLELENRWGCVSESLSRQSQSWLMLKYLLANPNRGVTLGELRENLWPDKSAGDRGESVDRVRLYRLREELRSLRLDGQNGLVLFQATVCRLNPVCELEFDTETLSNLLARLREVPADDSAGLSLCAKALEVFRGPFLANTEPAPWLECHRAAYRHLFGELAWTVLERMDALGDHSLTDTLCRRAADIAPEEEDLCREIAAWLIRQKKKSALGRFVHCLVSEHHVDLETEGSDLNQRLDAALPPAACQHEVNARLFGQVEVENQWGRAAENPSHPSFSWLLMKYLLVNAGREVPLEELLDTIWPEKPNINTDYAANIRLRRLREALAPLNLHGRKGLVLFHNGLYGLNPDYTVRTDAEAVLALTKKQGDITSHKMRNISKCISV